MFYGFEKTFKNLDELEEANKNIFITTLTEKSRAQ